MTKKMSIDTIATCAVNTKKVQLKLISDVLTETAKLATNTHLLVLTVEGVH